MWSNNKQSQSDSPNAAPAPAFQPPQTQSNFSSSPASAASAPVRSSAPGVKSVATLGSGLTVKGQIVGDEDLQVEGKVEGPITLKGQRLTVGKTGELVSDVHAHEIIVYGKVRGNLHASDRVEVKKDGSVIGNITGGRVMIEDGAYLKGQIEIQRDKNHSSDAHELETFGASASN